MCKVIELIGMSLSSDLIGDISIVIDDNTYLHQYSEEELKERISEGFDEGEISIEIHDKNQETIYYESNFHTLEEAENRLKVITSMWKG